jgi:hypothetical protein
LSIEWNVSKSGYPVSIRTQLIQKLKGKNKRWKKEHYSLPTAMQHEQK